MDAGPPKLCRGAFLVIGKNEMSITAADLIRIEGKLDLILDALGLTDNRRMAPCEIKEVANKIVLQFREKRANGQRRERKQNSGGRV